MSNVVSAKIYDLIKNLVNDNVENYTINVHDPNKKGEGFLGEICYVSLKNKDDGKVRDLVIKQSFSDEKLRITFPIRKYYLNEILFYTKIWPSFQTFQTERALRKPFDKIPKCFAVSSEFEHEKLALENLRYQNFQTYNKRKPFDDEHLTFILKEYGKYHGTSFAYKTYHPQEYHEITKDLEDLYAGLGKVKSFCDFVTYVLELSLESLDEKKDTKAIEKLKNLIENAIEMFQDKHNYRGNYSVVLHGDCWSNNMMFKYNEQKQLCDLRLLDFQLSKIGTPVSDLSYFFYSGGAREYFDQLDHYLEIYHKSLSSTLKEFGLDPRDIYPFEELKSDWKKYSFTGFTMGLLLWRSKLVYDGSVVDLTDLKGNEDDFNNEFQQSAFDRESFKLRSRDLLLHMVENDFI